jgi:hypothetical protein
LSIAEALESIAGPPRVRAEVTKETPPPVPAQFKVEYPPRRPPMTVGDVYPTIEPSGNGAGVIRHEPSDKTFEVMSVHVIGWHACSEEVRAAFVREHWEEIRAIAVELGLLGP